MNYLISTFITLPLGAAFLMLPLSRLHRRITDVISCLVTLYLFTASIFLYWSMPLGGTIVFRIAGWPAPVGINLVMDGLSHLLILTVGMVAFFISVYSVSYMEKYSGKAKYYTLFLLAVAGMNGVILTGDLINLFIFLELASVSSAALVAFGTKSEEMEASFKYMVMGSVASIMVLLAIVLTYGLSGSFNMAEIAQCFPCDAKHARMLITMLFIAGFGTKAAIVPFHAWLPDAHPSAPAPISAMLSGVLIKALGIYTITRVVYNVLGMTYPVSNILMFLGAASIIWGSFLAFRQDDMKRLMASSSIAQVGYIILGIGLATPLGLLGGLFHLFNHAVFKSLLFLTAGSVDRSAGTRSLKQLGGLRRDMPITAGTSLVGSLAISGIPPFNGFWSKLLIIIACIQSGRFWFAFAAVVGSVMTLAYFLTVQKRAFFGNAVKALKNVKESPLTMTLPMVCLALICLLAGLLFPQVVNLIINPAVATVAGGIFYSNILTGGM